LRPSDFLKFRKKLTLMYYKILACIQEPRLVLNIQVQPSTEPRQQSFEDPNNSGSSTSQVCHCSECCETVRQGIRNVWGNRDSNGDACIGALRCLGGGATVAVSGASIVPFSLPGAATVAGLSLCCYGRALCLSLPLEYEDEEPAPGFLTCNTGVYCGAFSITGMAVLGSLGFGAYALASGVHAGFSFILGGIGMYRCFKGG
jgi:hypothetical protein